MKPTKEQLETTAKTLQMLHDNYKGEREADDALYCLFGRMIGTFGKLYDSEEELLVLVDNMEDFQNGNAKYMFDDLINKEDTDTKRKQETENTRLIQQIRALLRTD